MIKFEDSKPAVRSASDTSSSVSYLSSMRWKVPFAFSAPFLAAAFGAPPPPPLTPLELVPVPTLLPSAVLSRSPPPPSLLLALPI